jgi:hypothetical protein
MANVMEIRVNGSMVNKRLAFITGVRWKVFEKAEEARADFVRHDVRRKQSFVERAFCGVALSPARGFCREVARIIPGDPDPNHFTTSAMRKEPSHGIHRR